MSKEKNGKNEKNKKNKRIITPKDVKENIINTSFTDEMKTSYLGYSMSVLGGRMLADVRDGLKPVQRRILFGMSELNLSPTSPYKKSARIVGDVMGKYHPHGDSSIYGALVTMSKDWMYPYPLVDGHGNFGSIEGDGAAAMRYTEARLSRVAVDMLEDLNKNTVDFIPNFDDTEKEPILLPAKIPNLLISGSEGIAVGMAASIPSHNLSEVIDAVLYYMKEKEKTGKTPKTKDKDKKIPTEKLMEYIQGPDFATGGIIANKKDLLNIYETGAGRIRVRGKVEIEEIKGGRQQLVITEIPQTMVGSIDKFMDSVAELYRSKKFPDMVDISNMSSKEGIRIVIELKKGTDPQKAINLLYRKTKLEDTFGVNMLAVKDYVPHIYSLSDFLMEFISFQFEIYTRKYKYLLNKEEKTKEIKEGLIKACDCIDLIIEILRGSKTKQMAKDCLIEGKTEGILLKTAKSKKDAAKLLFTERQADAILSMQLSSLIGLEILQLKKEYDACCKRIEEYNKYLKSDAEMSKKIQSELKDIQKRLSRPRRTQIIDADEIVLEKENIVEEDLVALIDRFGYIKLIDMPTYSRNVESIPGDYKHVVMTRNTDKIFLFTDTGMRHQIKCLDIPVMKYKDRGIPMENLCGLEASERIICISSELEASQHRYLFISSDSMCKLVPGSEFIASRSTIVATKFKEDSFKVVQVQAINDETDIILFTKNGFVLKFALDEISEMKKNSAGMQGMRFKKDDYIIAGFAVTGDSIVSPDGEKKVETCKIKRKKRAQAGVVL